MARLMPGSLAAAFFPSVCRRFQDGSLEAEHRFAFPGDAGETAAAGVLRQGFHPARPRPREPGHPADRLAFSAFMSNSMRRSSVNATICSTTATFRPRHRASEIRHIRAVPGPVRACPADAIAGAHEHDFHIQQLGQRRQAVPHRAPAGEDR
ncbi:MAG: hypothetical protein ACLR7Z_01455 [Bilophila wadsworthia]